MPPLLKYLLRRLLLIPVTLFVITATLYAIVMLVPAEVRAAPWLPERLPSRLTDEDVQRLIAKIVEEQGLDDPYPVQYVRWVSNLARGDWGYSPTMRGDILPMLIHRVPTTAELALYTSIFFIPLGLISGLLAAARRERPLDHAFRVSAFIGTSVPPFILALWLLALFYVSLRWFAPQRLGLDSSFLVNSPEWRTFTGLLTVDGLLNGRPDVSLEALRHLALPVLTLSLSHWATLGRLTRASVIEEMEKPYVTAARARGVTASGILWRHTFRNAAVPALNSTALSAASLVTGVYVVEVIFDFKGLSQLITTALAGTPDVDLAVGFAVLSVLLVLPIMLILDLVQAMVDPRIREGMTPA